MRLNLSLTPDPDDPACVQIFVPARARDEDVTLLLDSGARCTSLPATPSLAALPALGRSTSRGAGGTQPGHPLVALPVLEVGPLRERELEVELTPPGEPPFGLLGADILRRHRWHFRFTDGVAEIDVARPAGCFLLEVEPPDGAPTVELRVGASMVRAVWDTGAGTTVIDRAWALEHPDAVSLLGASAAGTDASGVAIAAERGRLAAVRIGGYTFPPSDCVVVDLGGLNQHLSAPLEIILGLPLLRLADWWFDFPARAWAVTKAPA